MKSRSTIDRLVSHSVSAAVIGVLVVIGMTIGASGIAVEAAAQEEGTDDAADYSVIQGDDCIPIEKFGDGSQTVEEFYDYRTPNTDPSSYTYSSYGTTQLQEADTSVLFLYEGRDGLSLVLVHDQYEGNSPGGAVTMRFDELPADGEWVVEDDSYSEDLGPGPFDEFDHGETSSRITWVYDENRNDGAAFRGGLDDEFAIEIEPAFNEEADFQMYEGELSSWQVLSPTDDGHEQFALEMDEQVVVRSGSCTSMAVTDLNVTETATVGEPIDVQAVVENDGHSEGTATLTFTVDDTPVDEQNLTIGPGETATGTTTVEFDEPGTYTLAAGDAAVDVTVSADDDTISDEVSGFGITVAATAAVAALLLALGVRSRRR